MSPNLESSFWERMGLEQMHREVCLSVVRELYPGHIVVEYRYQGYCSFTIQVSRLVCTSSSSNGPDNDTSTVFTCEMKETDTFIVQIRPKQHSLDLSIAQAASQTYGSFTPTVRHLDCNIPYPLQAYEMDMMRGIPFSHFVPQYPTIHPSTWTKRVHLVRSFATFIARAWPSTSNASQPCRAIRADSPMIDSPTPLSTCTGNVGTRITLKLNELAQRLPDATLRQRAAETRDKILEWKDFPIVLTHGDLIPSNVLVDEQTWQITGLVDWAEAEWLPFGTCLYGLEHMLGYLDSTFSSSSSSPTLYRESKEKPVWRYLADATHLREIFWTQLCDEAPGCRERREDVLLARDMGVLLWFGYAWDEGAIDRVVDEVEHAVEVECLRAFLSK